MNEKRIEELVDASFQPDTYAMVGRVGMVASEHLIRAAITQAAREAAEEERAKLKVAEEALRKYGAHSDSCGDMDAYNKSDSYSCDCGLAVALAAIRKDDHGH